MKSDRLTISKFMEFYSTHLDMQFLLSAYPEDCTTSPENGIQVIAAKLVTEQLLIAAAERRGAPLAATSSLREQLQVFCLAR
jgi:hypothetical protein